MDRRSDSFIVSHDDWSLHRKGHLDQERHQEKVREAIKRHLPDLVSEEAIITSDGARTIRVPVRSIQQYRFRYNREDQEQVGQGSGGTQAGDVLGRAPGSAGKGNAGAGDQPGDDVYEVEIDIDEIAEMVFADLSLPNVKPRMSDEIDEHDARFDDVRKQGMMGNLDKRRTLLEAIKRRALKGEAGPVVFSRDDLRFKTWSEVPRPVTNAVVFAMMDTSASMGTFEKYIARSFFFWMVRFLRTRYSQVEIVFLAHDTVAREVTEEQFFTRSGSGGTMCSSVYCLALQLIGERYPPSRYNLYAFHFSDGDNLPSDNALVLNAVREMTKRCNAIGYGEINPTGRGTTLMNVMKQVADERFVCTTLKAKEDVLAALQRFFRETLEEVG